MTSPSTPDGLTATDLDGTRVPVERRRCRRVLLTDRRAVDERVSGRSRSRLALDSAADRFAACEVPAGVLEEQEGSEDMRSDTLAEETERFQTARLNNTIAATNKYLRYREINQDASKMQLVEGRTYQASSSPASGNVPPYLVGAPAGTGMTYQNASTSQGRSDRLRGRPLSDVYRADVVGAECDTPRAACPVRIRTPGFVTRSRPRPTPWHPRTTCRSPTTAVVPMIVTAAFPALVCAADEGRRTVAGVAVPYGVEGVVADGTRVVFEAGSLDDTAPPRRPA